MSKPPKVMQGTKCKHLMPATVLRIQKHGIRPEMTESEMTLANGAKYMKLKPGIANGAEFAETWREYGL